MPRVGVHCGWQLGPLGVTSGGLLPAGLEKESPPRKKAGLASFRLGLKSKDRGGCAALGGRVALQLRGPSCGGREPLLSAQTSVGDKLTSTGAGAQIGEGGVLWSHYWGSSGGLSGAGASVEDELSEGGFPSIPASGVQVLRLGIISEGSPASLPAPQHHPF